MTTQTEQWFAFRAYNSQTIYGWGNAEEAERYADAINAGKEINLYGAYALTAEEASALKLGDRTDAINLEDELRARAEAVE